MLLINNLIAFLTATYTVGNPAHV